MIISELPNKDPLEFFCSRSMGITRQLNQRYELLVSEVEAFRALAGVDGFSNKFQKFREEKLVHRATHLELITLEVYGEKEDQRKELGKKVLEFIEKYFASPTKIKNAPSLAEFQEFKTSLNHYAKNSPLFERGKGNEFSLHKKMESLANEMSPPEKKKFFRFI
jgi:5-carboxymethyl-2-hydroxymuconate isomerase